MDDLAWGALAVALTLCSGLYTWTRARAKGTAAYARWAGITLLPLAAYFTHTLRLIGRIGTAVGSWATGFVWNPFVWLGLVLAVIAFVLIGVSTRLGGNRAGTAGGGSVAAPKGAKQVKGKSADLGLGDDLDDIQAILKKHGIS